MKRSAEISLVGMGKEQRKNWQKEEERLGVSFRLFGLLKQQNLMQEVDLGFFYHHSLLSKLVDLALFFACLFYL